MTTTTHELSRPGWVGPDGTPVVEDGRQKAERMTRLLDELAVMVDHTRDALSLQDDALGVIAAATSGGQRRLNEARKIARRSGRTLGLISDCLGEMHATCDELANRSAGTEGDQIQ